jgi:hypothetical protein
MLQIEERDKNMKERADATLRSISGNCRQQISQRIANELSQVTECRKIGDGAGTKRHELLAEIHKSLYNLEG